MIGGETGSEIPKTIGGKTVQELKLEKISQPFEEELGGISHTLVGQEGVIVSFDKLKPIAGGNWIMLDLDETIIKYEQAKGVRLDKYRQYLSELGLDLSEDQARQLMDITDRFSRFKETEKGSKLYHVEAHLTALNWATNQIFQVKNEPKKISERIEQTQTILARICDGDSQDQDPFMIQNGKFRTKQKVTWDHGEQFIHGPKTPHSETMTLDKVFKESTFKPEVFEQLIEAIKIMGGPEGSIHRNNIGIFTKGKMGFQEYKVLELLSEYPDLPISQVWISEVDKGDFMVRALETNAVSKPEMEYPPAELKDNLIEDYPGDSPALGAGYPLGNYPHVFIHIDDEAKQAANIVSKFDYLKEHTDAEIVVVRSIQPDTKTVDQKWEINTPYGVLDFTKPMNTQLILNILRANMYIKLREIRGMNDPVVIQLYKELHDQGMQIK